jgi:hypothetical protein
LGNANQNKLSRAERRQADFTNELARLPNLQGIDLSVALYDESFSGISTFEGAASK